MVVVVVVEVEGISLEQHSCLELHSSSAIQPPSSAQKRVPGGSQDCTKSCPAVQRQYLEVQHPSER